MRKISFTDYTLYKSLCKNFTIYGIDNTGITKSFTVSWVEEILSNKDLINLCDLRNSFNMEEWESAPFKALNTLLISKKPKIRKIAKSILVHPKCTTGFFSNVIGAILQADIEYRAFNRALFKRALHNACDELGIAR